jgi:hypothetical protein
MKLHAAALALVGWYMNSGRSGGIGVAAAPPETGSAGGHAIAPASRTFPPTYA